MFWRKIKCHHHLPSDSEYSSKVNCKCFNPEVTLQLRQKQQLLAVMKTESHFDKTDPGRKGLPNFLKVLRDWICLISNSQTPVRKKKKKKKVPLCFVLSFILAFCYSWDSTTKMGLVTGARSCQWASGDTCAHGNPKHGESKLSWTCIVFTFRFKWGITAGQMGGHEGMGHQGLIQEEIRAFLSLPDMK